MKKIIVILIVVLSNYISYTFDDVRHAQESTSAPQASFLDAADKPDVVEWLAQENVSDTRENISTNDLSDLAEYDQNVSDNAPLPYISPAEKMMANIFGTVLLHYINMRDSARLSCQKIKNKISQWYNSCLAKA